MPGTMQETAISAKQCIPSGRRRNYVLPRASGEWLWQSCFVPTFTARAEEAGAVRRSCQFDRLLAFQPQAWRTINKRTGRYGHSSRLCPLSKLHHLTTHEEREKQDRQPRVHQAINKQLYDLWKVPTPEGCLVWSLLGHRPKWFWNDRTKLGHFGQNVWKCRLMPWRVLIQL